MQYRRLVLPLILLFASAYAGGSAAQTAQNDGIQSLRFTAQFKTKLGNDVDPAQLPDVIIVGYRLDPGWVFLGSRHSSPGSGLQGFTLGRDELTLDLPAWIAAADANAKPLMKKEAKLGFSVTPADTRLGTVYQITYSPGSGRLGGRYLGRYHDLKTVDGHLVALMFFDRPCRLQGKVELNNEEQDIVHVELDVAGRGFHFLRWVRRPDGGIGLVIAPPQSEVVFVTHF